MRRRARRAIEIVLGACVVVAGFLGLILFLDLAGLSIYFFLQGGSWNFNALSGVLLAEGFTLMGIGALVLSSREGARVDYMGGAGKRGWHGPVITKIRRLSLYEEELALVLLVTGIFLFILGLFFFGT